MPQPAPPPEASTVAALQQWGRATLSGDDARHASEMLLAHALQRDRAWLYAHAHEPVAGHARLRFVGLIAQRSQGVPVAHLLGRWGFWTLDLRITADTLIPRPETELLVELALERIALDAEACVADLGTGSGAIALALARERPRARVIATDASIAALEVARGNARTHAIANVEFRAGDWYAALGDQRCDLIASNPPYIASGDAHLARGDLRFEPLGALVSGDEGLDAIRVLAAGAAAHLTPGGCLLVEHGHEQGAAVRQLFAAAGLVEVETRRDLESRERITLGARPA